MAFHEMIIHDFIIIFRGYMNVNKNDRSPASLYIRVAKSTNYWSIEKY